MRGFAELTLAAEDPESVARFYSEVFGMRRLGADRDRIWLAAGPSARLGIWTPETKEHSDRGGRHVHFAVSVSGSELEAILTRARASGAECEGPVEHAGGDRSVYVTDPAGHRAEAWDYFARRPSAEPPGA